MQSRWANVDWDVTSRDEFNAFNAAQDEIIARVRNDFYFHLISQLASRGTAVNRQLFFISLVMRHKGLSRSGLNMLSMMNLGLSPRSFDPELSDQLDRYRAYRRSETSLLVISFFIVNYFHRRLRRERIVVTWLDNFSKCYAVAVQSVDNGAFRDCYWTGKAFRTFISSNRSGIVNSISIVNNAPVPGMPNDLFTAGIRGGIFATMARVFGHSWKKYQQSLVTRYNVNNIPCKPVVDVMDPVYPILKRKPDGLREFYPEEILPQNIGSNRGLLVILKQMSDDRSAASTKYELLCCDCNIFMRIIKVIPGYRC